MAEFKLQNGKRRWRKILKLEGYSRKDIQWFADYDRENQKKFYKSNGVLWKYNADWRQNSLSQLNYSWLFNMQEWLHFLDSYEKQTEDLGK